MSGVLTVFLAWSLMMAFRMFRTKQSWLPRRLRTIPAPHPSSPVRLRAAPSSLTLVGGERVTHTVYSGLVVQGADCNEQLSPVVSGMILSSQVSPTFLHHRSPSPHRLRVSSLLTTSSSPSHLLLATTSLTLSITVLRFHRTSTVGETPWPYTPQPRPALNNQPGSKLQGNKYHPLLHRLLIVYRIAEVHLASSIHPPPTDPLLLRLGGCGFLDR